MVRRREEVLERLRGVRSLLSAKSRHVSCNVSTVDYMLSFGPLVEPAISLNM